MSDPKRLTQEEAQAMVHEAEQAEGDAWEAWRVATLADVEAQRVWEAMVRLVKMAREEAQP